MLVMGSACSSKSTADGSEIEISNSQNNTQRVPYIVVSSVSLSRKIADEHMCVTVTNTPTTSSSRPHSNSYYRNTKSARRRRRHCSITPEPHTKDTIVIVDEQNKNKMQVEIEHKGDVPYLSLSSANLQKELSPTVMSSVTPPVTPPIPPAVTPNMTPVTSETPSSRVTSVVSLAESKDDVSLTSELLRPETQRRKKLESLNSPKSRLSADSIMAGPEADISIKRSDSTKINRLRSSDPNVYVSGEDDDNTWWETASMKQELSKAKSISAIDLLQQFKENRVADKDISVDESDWRWFESRSVGKSDSGRSSPSERHEDEVVLEEVIAAKLELLSLYAPIKGPTMQSRVVSIANEIVVIYEKLTHRRLQVEMSVRELISNVDAIRSYRDMQHYVYMAS